MLPRIWPWPKLCGRNQDYRLLLRCSTFGHSPDHATWARTCSRVPAQFLVENMQQLDDKNNIRHFYFMSYFLPSPYIFYVLIIAKEQIPKR